MERQLSHAVVGGGCFWCLEAVFERIAGVESVVSGYAGGAVDSPSYQAVCSGSTGHAEVIQITFDVAVITFRELLEIFFSTHDPTTINRQGHDIGTQYRSAIFAADSGQSTVASELIAELNRDDVFGAPVVTDVTPLERFWPADAYHQQYFRRNPAQQYCAAVIAPKVAALRARWAAKLRPSGAAMPTPP